jgi:ABC-type transport system substrate-binding protein
MKKATLYTVLSIMVVSMFVVSPAANVAAADPVEFLYGVGSLVADLDPHQAWDSASIDVIEQVCEGLFGYNLSDPYLAIVPVLSVDMGAWNAEADEFTVTLRQGVTFHDGSKFNATDVKYTFDRLNNLITLGESQIAELYEPLADIHPDNSLVIDEVEIVSEYVVKFVLNYPYVAFVPLLCFSGSVILPDGEYPVDELMDVASDKLVGTGPFEYISQTAEQTTLEGYDDYWQGAPALDFIYFVYYADATTKNQAFLAKDLHAIDGVNPEMLETFRAHPDFYVGNKRPNTVIQYMGMNNKQINMTMRQAISHAINYDYIISEILKGNAIRMTSPVPAGILYHKPCAVATYDVEKARQILVDAGLLAGKVDAQGNPVTMDSSNSAWQYLSANNPIATYNYSYNTGNSVRQDLGTLVKNGLYSIGIKLDVIGMTWPEYLTRLLGDFDKLQLYMIGWAADYNDPSNFINPLFSNTSHSNGAQVNDAQLQGWMMDALTITDPATREAKYHDIQEYIVEELMPWVFLTTGFGPNCRRRDVNGFIRNPMAKLYFYPVHFGAFEEDNPYVPIVAPTTTTTTTTGTTEPGPGIPGYSLIALLGVAAFTATALIYKKRK